MRLFSLFRLPSKLRRRARRSRMVLVLILAGLFLVTFFPLYIIYKPPALLIRYFQYRWPDVLFHVSTTSKVVALTIDDGPSEYTKSILQILKENDATATFFLIGSQIPGREGVLRELIENGNELANHAMYDEPSRSLSDDELRVQLQDVDATIKQAYATTCKEPPRYFRPGSGFFNTRMRVLVKSMGLRMVLSDIYPHDPQIRSWQINAWHILSMLQTGGIVICHDRRSWTAPMLRKVLPQIRKRGYRVVTLTELLQAEDG